MQLRSPVLIGREGAGELQLARGTVTLEGRQGPVFRTPLSELQQPPARVHWYSDSHLALHAGGDWHQLRFQDPKTAAAWRMPLAPGPGPQAKSPPPPPRPPRAPSEPPVHGPVFGLDPMQAAALARLDARTGLFRDNVWRRTGVIAKQNLELRLTPQRLALGEQEQVIFDAPLRALSKVETPWYRSGHMKLTIGPERHVICFTERASWNADTGFPPFDLLWMLVYSVIRIFERRRGRRVRREWRDVLTGRRQAVELVRERLSKAEEKAIEHARKQV